MHVLLATLTVPGSIEDLKPILASYGESLVDTPGYVDHFWLVNRKELGLFHLFTDRKSLQHYTSSNALAMLAAHPACDGRVYARQYELLSDVKRYALGPLPGSETAPAMIAESSPVLGD